MISFFHLLFFLLELSYRFFFCQNYKGKSKFFEIQYDEFPTTYTYYLFVSSSVVPTVVKHVISDLISPAATCRLQLSQISITYKQYENQYGNIELSLAVVGSTSPGGWTNEWCLMTHRNLCRILEGHVTLTKDKVIELIMNVSEVKWNFYDEIVWKSQPLSYGFCKIWVTRGHDAQEQTSTRGPGTQ